MTSRLYKSKEYKRWSLNSADQLRSDYINAEEKSAEHQPPDLQMLLPTRSEEDTPRSAHLNSLEALQSKPKAYRNRFLNFVRLGSLVDNAAESFFKSEIRRRLFVTAVLIVLSRVGYFIPLPGFDRRLIPKDYLSFVSGSVGRLSFLLVFHNLHFVYI